MIFPWASAITGGDTSALRALYCHRLARPHTAEPDDLTLSIGAKARSPASGAYGCLPTRERCSRVDHLFIRSTSLLRSALPVPSFTNAALATTDVVNAGGGVAWFAHVGGFAAGVVLVKLFVLGRSVPPAQPRVLRRRTPW
jgi:hypothetical protein